MADVARAEDHAGLVAEAQLGGGVIELLQVRRLRRLGDGIVGLLALDAEGAEQGLEAQLALAAGHDAQQGREPIAVADDVDLAVVAEALAMLDQVLDDLLQAHSVFAEHGVGVLFPVFAGCGEEGVVLGPGHEGHHGPDGRTDGVVARIGAPGAAVLRAARGDHDAQLEQAVLAIHPGQLDLGVGLAADGELDEGRAGGQLVGGELLRIGDEFLARDLAEELRDRGVRTGRLGVDVLVLVDLDQGDRDLVDLGLGARVDQLQDIVRGLAVVARDEDVRAADGEGRIEWLGLRLLLALAHQMSSPSPSPSPPPSPPPSPSPSSPPSPAIST